MSTSTKTQINRARRLKQKAARVAAGLPANRPRRNKNPTRTARSRPSQPLPRVTPLQQTVRLSDCTKAYASCLVDPFGPITTLPCIPDTMVLPSHKFMARCRGVFSTGNANGIGYVAFNPDAMAASDNGVAGSTVNYPIVYTSTAYSSVGYTFAAGGGTITTVGVFGANSNSPYDTAFISSGNRAIRVVAAGVRIRYIGTDYKNQGRVILARSQTNIGFAPNGTTDGSVLMNDNYTVSVPVSRSSEYIFYIPDDPGAVVYSNYADWLGNNRRAYLIYIDGGDTTTGQSWEFEAVAFFETIGPNMPLTKSDSDPVGMGGTMSSLPTKAPSTTPAVQKMNILSKVANYIAQVSSQVVTTGGSRVLAGALQFGAMNLLRPTQGLRIQNSAPTVQEIED